jgi:hypothetical protein
MTPDFESLFEELETVISAQPRQSMSNHYRLLFDYLCEKFDRDIWVERSGGSLQVGAKLLHLFPDARVLHLVRDGRDTAISMSKHHGIRILVGTYKMLSRRNIDLRNQLVNPMFSRKYSTFVNAMYSIPYMQRIIESEQLDLEDFGDYWSFLEIASQEYMSSIPRENYLRLKFEDILDRPRETISQMIQFIGDGLLDESWLDRAQAVPRPTPARYPKLDAAERRRLTAACAPGLEALGYSYDQ